MKYKNTGPVGYILSILCCTVMYLLKAETSPSKK